MKVTKLFLKDLELIATQLDTLAYEVENETHAEGLTQEQEQELWDLHAGVTEANNQLKKVMENAKRS